MLSGFFFLSALLTHCVILAEGGISPCLTFDIVSRHTSETPATGEHDAARTGEAHPRVSQQVVTAMIDGHPRHSILGIHRHTGQNPDPADPDVVTPERVATYATECG